MFIQTENTPNPLTMKFLPGVTVLASGTATITDKADAKKRSPLAHALFGIEHVTSVFLAEDFITVTKAEDVAWSTLKPAVLTTIMEHFVAGLKVLNDGEANAETKLDDNEDPIVKQIKELIDTRVRPAVAMDGGDIVYKDFKDGIVKLELHGSCQGCPSSTATLKNGIENMLKHYVPEVVAVEAVA
ncbi:MAG: NifU family protein [Alphaproteobacteria bacterium]|nr:NifU family protein [Alphaproteobacteria bacterium]